MISIVTVGFWERIMRDLVTEGTVEVIRLLLDETSLPTASAFADGGVCRVWDTRVSNRHLEFSPGIVMFAEILRAGLGSRNSVDRLDARRVDSQGRTREPSGRHHRVTGLVDADAAPRPRHLVAYVLERWRNCKNRSARVSRLLTYADFARSFEGEELPQRHLTRSRVPAAPPPVATCVATPGPAGEIPHGAIARQQLQFEHAQRILGGDIDACN